MGAEWALTTSPPVTAVACGHCGSQVPAGRSVAPEMSFCCDGCETVHEALLAHDLGDWYALAGAERRPAITTRRSYGELDHAAYHQLHVRQVAPDLAMTSFFLEGLHCAGCVWLVERLPTLTSGVREVRVDLGRSRAEVLFEPARAQLSTVARLLDRLGHPVHPYRGSDREQLRRREARTLLLRLGIAGAVASHTMMLAAALYAGEGEMSLGDTSYFRWLSLFLTVPAIVYSAAPFFRGALAAVIARRLHVDLPIAVGLGGGLAWGAFNVVRGEGHIYFDSLGMLVFLLLAARWLQTRQQRRAGRAAELLLALSPRVARRVDGDGIREVPLEALSVGDVVAVEPGEVVPVDGEVVTGTSDVDVAFVTGESRPVAVSTGATVFAGAKNLRGALEVRASATGEDTRLGRIARRLDELSSRRPQLQGLVDRSAARLVATVLVLAVLTVVAWSFVDVELGFEHAIALLVVTCPCALALATPLTMGIALGRAARRGMLIKGADALERLAKPGTIVFDKTGTLTTGLAKLTYWDGSDQLLRAVRALERGSRHPLARAFVGGEEPVCGAAATQVEEHAGRGISGWVDGQRLRVGSVAWIGAGAPLEPALIARVQRLAARGETPMVVEVDGQACAVAAVSDPIRSDAASAIAALEAAGWKVRVLSGDDPKVVEQVGRVLGLAAHAYRGGVDPETKLDTVEGLARQGTCIMVGDGANDAAALAASSCGIAVSGSVEASIEAADAVLCRPGISGAVELIRGAGETLAAIRRCLRVSLVYNLVGGGLAIAGLLHPLWAALLMPASSLSVLAIASWSRAYRGGAS